MKYEYYVVMRRLFKEKEVISIYDFEGALKSNWIDKDGNRIWVVPPKNEGTITFVWGFNDINMAINFYEALLNNELGIKCEEI